MGPRHWPFQSCSDITTGQPGLSTTSLVLPGSASGSKVMIHIKAHIPFLGCRCFWYFIFYSVAPIWVQFWKEEFKENDISYQRWLNIVHTFCIFAYLQWNNCWSIPHCCLTFLRGPLSSVVIMQIVMVQSMQWRLARLSRCCPRLTWAFIVGVREAMVDALC